MKYGIRDPFVTTITSNVHNRGLIERDIIGNSCTVRDRRNNYNVAIYVHINLYIDYMQYVYYSVTHIFFGTNYIFHLL